MPEYDIRLPDGRTVTVRAPSPEAAQSGVRDWWSQQQRAEPGYASGNVASEARGPVPPPASPYPTGDGKTRPRDAEQEREWRASGWLPAGEDANTADVAAKVGQGFFANWGDEIAATAGALPNIITGGRIGRDRQTILQELRDRERALEEQHPGLATAAELAGAVGSGALTGGIGAGRAAPTIGRTALRSAAIAAPIGAADALGRMEGESDIATKLGTAAAGAGIAGLTGGTVGALGQTLGRVIAPMASDLAQRLTARGVELTPAEVLGVPALSRLEDKAAAVVPFIGGQIRDRAAEGVTSLNRAAYREVLAPMMGRRAADRVMGDRVGHEAITRLTDVFNRRYRSVVRRMSAAPDARLGQEIGRIMQDLPSDAQARFAEGVDRYVNNLVDGNGRIAGERLQGTMESLRTKAQEYGASLGDPSHRDLGRAFGDLRTALLDSAERHSAPRAVQSFRRVQAAYRRFRPVRQAAAAVTSPEGRFTPAQLHSAVRAADESAGKGATARGDAVLQDLSSPARAVMTPKAAGSPTAERLAFAGAGGLGGAAGAGAVEPVTALSLLAMGIPPALLYSRRGARAFQRFATNPARGPVRAAISNATVRASPGIGMLTERMVGQDAE